ncbi:MAG: Gfo/Idh/MocA family oxidoreductase [Alphaproteobacteria bacterium]|nr:Gfo/Idh/MocA family oxidoreductase [Alphaproteobacteria bacterium]
MAGFKQINVGVIGTGWVGGIRANACAQTVLVDELHIAEIDPVRQAEITAETNPASMTDDWRTLIENDSIDAIIIAMTPETARFPIVMGALEAGKHVFVEKPIAPSLAEAEQAYTLAKASNLKITVGYSRRFDPRYAYVRKALQNGLIGEPVTCLISRHSTRELGEKITGRSKMSPTSIGGVHDLDFVLWCLQPRKPVRIYSQTTGKLFSRKSDTPDHQWVMVTMNDGTTVTIGIGWILPAGYPNFVQAWIEVIGTEGALSIDDTHKEIQYNTVHDGIRYPMSSMPGEQIDHIFAGSMLDETKHFLEAVAYDRPTMVREEEALLVMQVYNAADLSAELGEPVMLPTN